MSTWRGVKGMGRERVRSRIKREREREGQASSFIVSQAHLVAAR